MKYFYLTIFLMILFVPMTQGMEWIVNQNGTGDFDSIQEALDSSAVISGDTIIVMPGIYREFIVAPSYKALTIKSLEGPSSTIIMPPYIPSTTKPLPTVLIKSQTTFEGFMITMDDSIRISFEPFDLAENPDPLLWPDNTIGIMLTGPATIRNNIVRKHRIGTLEECSCGTMTVVPQVEFNEFFGNDVGIACCETATNVRNNISHDNSWMGIICSHAASCEVINNLVYRNGILNRIDSAGILCWQMYDIHPDYSLSPLIMYNTVVDNYCDGIRCVWQRGGLCTPVLVGNIIADNEGYGVRCRIEGNGDLMPRPIIRRCDFWNNALGVMYNVTRIVQCYQVDPKFTDDYRLSEDSPCRDLGGISFNWGTTSARNTPDDIYIDLGYHYDIPLDEPASMIR